MTLRQMFRLMIEVGRRADWRDEATFEAQLAARRAEYEALGEAERRFFDTERLWNPFGCSRICSGEPDMEVRGMVVGINPSLAAVLYAERLRDGGLPVDALLTHHGMPPAGTIYDDINNTHYHVLRDFGVPEDTARSVVQEAINGYYRRMVGEPTALEQNTDLALFSVHNPMDNLTGLFLTQLMARRKPRTVGEVVELLLELEEFAIAARGGIPPRIEAGSPDSPAGTVYVDVLGGICLNDRELGALLETGNVQTVIRLNYGRCIELCRRAGVNLVLFPHNAQDNVGINLMLDQVLAAGPVEVFPTDGFYRVEREPLRDFQWPRPIEGR